MPFDANDFRKPTRPPVLEFGLLLKDEFFLMCPGLGFSDVAIKVDCGYTCSEELNTKLVIAILVPPIFQFPKTSCDLPANLTFGSVSGENNRFTTECIFPCGINSGSMLEKSSFF